MDESIPAGEAVTPAPSGTPSPPMAPTRTPTPAVTPRLLAHSALPRARSLATWVILVRPHALLLAIAPVFVSLTVLAAGGAHINWHLGCATVFAIGLAQAGCSAIDAYLEHERRARALSAGESVVARTPSPLLANGIYPLEALRAGCVLLALAGVAALPLLVSGGLPVIALSVTGAVVGLLYSTTPYALKRYPVGDILLFAALGPGIVALAALAQRQRVTLPLLVVGIALGFYVLASVFAAHLRDTARLRALGRRTLSSLLSERQIRQVCAACIALPYLILLPISLPIGLPHTALLAYLSLPAAIVPITGVLRAASGNPQSLVVRQVARAYGLFALWLSVGFLLAALWLNLP